MEYGRVVVWLVAYAGLAALALPATSALFSWFPRRGAGLTVPVSLAVIGVVAYWVGRVRFGYVALLAGLAVLAGLSALAVYSGVEIDRRGYAEAMVVFSVAFLFLVGIRALDPSVRPPGGEKFLDFGLLSSLARSPTLPPEDMWFAGEPVQYYYGGHMLASLLGKLTATPPRFAYNLSLAGFYAMAVTAAYTLAGAVAADRGRGRRVAAGFGAFFVAFASNLLTPVRLVVSWIPGAQEFFRTLDANGRGIDDLVAPDALPWTPAYEPWNLDRFGYWDASRIIDGTVNEFPFFAYLNGDLHAHMMAMGLVLLVAAILFAYWQTPGESVRRRRWIVFGVVPAVAGLIAVVNTWSYPTVLGIAWLGVLFAPASPSTLLGLDRIFERVPGGVQADGGYPTGTERGVGSTGDVAIPGGVPVSPRRELVRTGSSLLVAGLLAAGSVVVAFPFLTGSTGGRGLGFVSSRSSIWGLVLVHGVFLALLVRHLLPRARPDPTNRRRAAVVVGTILALGLLAGVVHVVPFVLLVVLAWVLLRSDADVGYETALAVGALGVIVLVEFVYVTGFGTVSRFNTVFKTYSDVWLLWSVSGAVILATYLDLPGLGVASGGEDGTPTGGEAADGNDGGRGAPTDADAEPGSGTESWRRWLSVALAGVLIVSLSLYGTLALADHLGGHLGDEEPTTLDALTFVEREHPREAEAIAFVRNLEGQPNIATAPTQELYQWSGGADPVGGSAPASLTGVPTLAGWAHEIGYRGEAAWQRRVEDVETIYDGTPEQQVQQLRAHDVEYVYVGPAERDRFLLTDLDDRLTGVTVAFESEHVTIYRVHQAQLGVADG